MDRRDFLTKGTVAAGLVASQKVLEPLAGAKDKERAPIGKRRLGKTGADLSIIALGGVTLMDTEQSFANNLVAEAFDRGINYYDVAPQYGNAQERLGPALEPYRQKVFLACKTLERTKVGAAAELGNSLRLLRTDHVDLYQLHALTKMEDLEKAVADLQALGVPLETPLQGSPEGYRDVLLRDPDGYLIEVGQTTMTSTPMDLYV